MRTAAVVTLLASSTALAGAPSVSTFSEEAPYLAAANADASYNFDNYFDHLPPGSWTANIGPGPNPNPFEGLFSISVTSPANVYIGSHENHGAHDYAVYAFDQSAMRDHTGTMLVEFAQPVVAFGAYFTYSVYTPGTQAETYSLTLLRDGVAGEPLTVDADQYVLIEDDQPFDAVLIIATTGEGAPSVETIDDLTGRLAVIAPCPGDLDDDSVVGSGDLAVVLAAWGQTESPADLDEDTVVGAGDLAVLLAAWGACD